MKEFGEFERQAVMIHEQLAAGEIYYEARDQLAKLADKLKGHRRTPRETPTVNPVFIVEMHLMMTDGAPQASSVSDDFWLTYSWRSKRPTGTCAIKWSAG